MNMHFLDGDGRLYKRYFRNPKIEVAKFIDKGSDKPNNWINIQIKGDKDYSIKLGLDPDEVQSLLWALVFDDAVHLE